MNLRPTPQDRVLLQRLYRLSPEFRHWLQNDYARSKILRTRVDSIARQSRPPAIARFAELTDDNGPWLVETRRLKRRITSRIYGGLTWSEVMRLLHQCQAGGVDLGVFLLVQDWRKSGEASPALMWAGLALLDSVLPTGRRRLLRHLDQALAFVRAYEDKAARRSAVGYGDWWKSQVLLHILRHPCDSYSTRELKAQLGSLGLDISARDIRRFCTRHGIKRDMRAGRPSKPIKCKATPGSQ
jgi:hypothetical protein